METWRNRRQTNKQMWTLLPDNGDREKLDKLGPTLERESSSSTEVTALNIVVCFLRSFFFFFHFQIGNRGTVKEAAGFDPESDVKKLREAMKGMGEWTDQSNCRKKKNTNLNSDV